MGSGSGTKKKHWAEKARMWAWYDEVARRTDWSDHRLDKEFARKPGVSLTPDLRARVFGAIKGKNARQPTGNKDWRSASELAAAVGAHPSFAGTEELYRADIWDFLQEHFVEAKVLENRTDALLERYSLVRIDPLTSDEFSTTAMELGLPALYKRSLALSLHNLPHLDQFSLLWNLYLATEQAVEWQIRKLLESQLDRWFDNFFFENFAERGYHVEFYMAAIDAMLKVRIDPSTEASSLLYLGQLSRQLVLPSNRSL